MNEPIRPKLATLFAEWKNHEHDPDPTIRQQIRNQILMQNMERLHAMIERLCAKMRYLNREPNSVLNEMVVRVSQLIDEGKHVSESKMTDSKFLGHTTNFERYVGQMAYNSLMDTARRNERSKAESLDNEHVNQDMMLAQAARTGRNLPPDVIAEQRELQEQFDVAYAQLTPFEQTVFALSFFDNRKDMEIAESLGMEPNEANRKKVNRAYWKATAQLKNHLRVFEDHLAELKKAPTS